MITPETYVTVSAGSSCYITCIVQLQPDESTKTIRVAKRQTKEAAEQLAKVWASQMGLEVR